MNRDAYQPFSGRPNLLPWGINPITFMAAHPSRLPASSVRGAPGLIPVPGALCCANLSADRETSARISQLTWLFVIFAPGPPFGGRGDADACGRCRPWLEQVVTKNSSLDALHPPSVERLRSLGMATSRGSLVVRRCLATLGDAWVVAPATPSASYQCRSFLNHRAKTKVLRP